MKKLLIGLTLVTGLSTLSGCTILEDKVTNLESNTTGLERTVTIYNFNGDIIKQYHGTNVRTEVDGNQILVNLDGKRFQAFGATVLVEEKGVENKETELSKK